MKDMRKNVTVESTFIDDIDRLCAIDWEGLSLAKLTVQIGECDKKLTADLVTVLRLGAADPHAPIAADSMQVFFRMFRQAAWEETLLRCPASHVFAKLMDYVERERRSMEHGRTDE